MNILLIILAILLFIGGISGCIIPALPGPPLAFIAMLLAKWSGYIELSITSLIIFGLITIGVTVIDFWLTPWMTKRFGGSKGGNWGAMIGLVVGLFLPFPIGPLLGPFAGAFIGELLINRSKSSIAFTAALGAFLSFFVGTGLKLLACVSMIVYSIFQIHW